MPGEVAPAAPAAPAPSAPASTPGSSGPSATSPNPNAPGQGGTPPPPGTTPAPEPKYFERTLKMNGVEKKVRVTEDDLFNAYRHHESLREQARVVGETRKEFEQRMAELEEYDKNIMQDPFARMRQKDPNFDEVEYLTAQLHQRLATAPQDPREAALQQRERAIQEQERKFQMTEQQKQQEAEAVKEREELSNVGAFVLRALEPTGLPKDDVTLDLAARVYFNAKEEGIELSEQEVGELTFKAAVDQQNAIFGKLSGDQIIERFPEASRKIHEALVAKYKAKQGAVAPAAPFVPRAVPSEQGKPRTEAEAHREAEAQAGRRLLRTI